MFSVEGSLGEERGKILWLFFKFEECLRRLQEELGKTRFSASVIRL